MPRKSIVLKLFEREKVYEYIWGKGLEQIIFSGNITVIYVGMILSNHDLSQLLF
jgi:hypothetical protein